MVGPYLACHAYSVCSYPPLFESQQAGAVVTSTIGLLICADIVHRFPCTPHVRVTHSKSAAALIPFGQLNRPFPCRHPAARLCLQFLGAW